MFISYLYLTIASLLPVILLVIYFLLNKYTAFQKLPYCIKQIIYGISFGGLAILGTHWGIKFNGYTANARDAAVLICGLLLGGPSGIIAGTIGGVERLIIGLIYPESFGFTLVACSVSTFLAGIMAFLLRRFVYAHKKPSLIPGFFTGLIIESFHLFMVYVTNISKYQQAYDVVASCEMPMIVFNSAAVLVAILVNSLLENGISYFKNIDTKTLSRRFGLTLSGLTLFAFLLTSAFVFLINDSIVKSKTNEDLSYALSETASEVSYKTIEKAYVVKDIIDENPSIRSSTELIDFCKKEGLKEINLIDIDGYIRYSSVQKYVDEHFCMDDSSVGHEQTKDFHDKITAIGGPGYYVQEFRAPTDIEASERKYAGVLFSYDFDEDGTKEPGYIQVGYDQNGVDKLVQNIANYKNIGKTGTLLILNKDFHPISKAKDATIPDNIDNLIYAINTNEHDHTFKFVTADGVECFAQYRYEDTHYIISLITTDEATLTRDISISVNTLLELIVFGLIFITVFILVKKLVIEKIEKTNESLSKITNGDLNEVISLGSTSEFKELATDINKTVTSLKGYIDAANKRIDEELALAKAIQSAVLPNTFPAFPDRKEFDIFASMHPAKEVGGDFYDFYFSNQDSFHFTIADVSGKGIPAALFMMRAKSVLKSLTQTNIPINEAFIKGNNSLCDGNEAGMFVTAWSSSIDLNSGVLTFANGGHNPPLIKHKNGKFEYLKAPVNLVLAAMSDMPYKLNEIKLQPGDTIYLYTDGVTEGVNKKGEQLGEERLKNILNAKEFNNCEELCKYAYEECVKFANGAAQFDDITMVAFKYIGK